MKKVVALVFLIFVFCFTMVGCNNSNEEEPNYPVAGIWHACESWHEDNPYNYQGDTYILDVYFDFKDDGTLKNKSVLTLNGNKISDSGWIIVNMTWTINKNVISLSGGKTFVIVDDEFNDTWPNPQLTLHFIKE